MGKSIPFLVDTGATYSVLPSFIGTLTPSQILVMGVDRTPSRPWQTPLLNCSLDGFPFYHSFLVIPPLPYPTSRRDVLPQLSTTLQVMQNPTPSSSLILLLLENPPPPLPSPSFPTVLTPQLMQYGGELRDKPTRLREKRAVFLPMLVGLTFTTTLAAAGIGSTGLAHSLQTTPQSTTG